MEPKRKGDRKSMTLLPSFNGSKTGRKPEIQTSLDTRLTRVKRLATLDPNFFLFQQQCFISVNQSISKKLKNWGE